MPDRVLSIYRESALRHYIHGREKDVLPRLVSPPAFLLLWLVLGLLVVCGVLAWSVHVPVYTSGAGIVQRDAQGQARAVIFLPVSQLSKLHAGQEVHLTIGSVKLSEPQHIATVESEILSPVMAEQRYGLSGTVALLVQQPSVAVVVNPGPQWSLSLYEGAVVQAQIQVGSQRLLALLPLIGNGVGE